MTKLNLLMGLVLAASLSACAASADKVQAAAVNNESMAEQDHAFRLHDHSTHNHKTHGHIETVKPGASVTLNSVLPKSMTSGTFQTVQLRLTDGYQAGVMSVTVEPSEGLSLFGSASSKTFDMTKSGEHILDLDVKADTDGVYFLNVFTEAEGLARSFSVRLDMGQTNQKMFDDAMPADGEGANSYGERVWPSRPCQIGRPRKSGKTKPLVGVLRI